jgi:hypothetical protein
MLRLWDYRYFVCATYREAGLRLQLLCALSDQTNVAASVT